MIRGLLCNRFTLARQKAGIKRLGPPKKTGRNVLHTAGDLVNFETYAIGPEVVRQLVKTKGRKN